VQACASGVFTREAASRQVIRLLVVGLLAVLAGCIACRSSPDPAALVAEADLLRRQFDKDARLRAIERYRAALAAWTRSGDERNAAITAQRMGSTFGLLGRLRESVQALAEALRLSQGSGDRALESDILSDLGSGEALAADRPDLFTDAEGHCETALALARQSGATRETAKALSCRGDVEYYRRELDRALAYYGQAEMLWQQLGDRRGLALVARLTGAVHSDLSDLDRAHQCYQRSLALSTALGDKQEEAIVLVHEARLLARRGESQEALNRYEKALVALEGMGDLVWEGSTLTGIASVYRETGDAGAALGHYERARRVFERAGLNSVAVDMLIALGETSLAAGDPSAALTRFEEVRTVADQLDNRYWQAWALRFAGVAHLARGEPQRARSSLERALEVQRSIADPRLEARVRADLGTAHHLLGAHGTAAGFFERAVALSRQSGDRVTEATGLFGLARASASAHDLAGARAFMESSLVVAESLRTDVERRDLRSAFLASVFQRYELHIDILMRLHGQRGGAGLAARAFEASERARARSLVESLTDARVDPAVGVDPDLLRREQLCKEAFENLAERRRRLTGTASASVGTRSLDEEHRSLEGRYNQIQADIRRSNPRYAALAQPQPLSLRDIQREVLDADTLLLEYALGEERSYLWAVSRNGLASYVLPPRAQIEELAGRVYADMSAGGPTAAGRADADARRLSELLLGPVAGRIAGKRLLIVADGALQYVSFAALPVPARAGAALPMVAEHEMVSLPSASVLAILRRDAADRRARSGSVAVFADPVFEADDPRERAALRTSGGRRVPDAPAGAPPAPSRLLSTREEAAAIVEAAPPGTSLTRAGFDANRAAARDAELGRYRIVHFATHGVVDNENPGQSGIYLSLYGRDGQPQAGLLSLQDIYALRLPVELVVLSACSTALGKPVRGEGLVGTVRGFMYAGARRVVASLWKVDDDATRELMREFYAGMLRDNLPPSAALRRAQLAMRQHDRWQAPFYWAAFVLQGEWQ
jgi:CHAT domain-containing protein/tetratricopeptide (TPR) repeat protein